MSAITCFFNMRNNFDRIKPMHDILPAELVDIIYEYAYDLKEATLAAIAGTAVRNTFLMPVPDGWKTFLINNGDNTHTFNWRKFLKDVYQSPIDMAGVKETLKLMNWNSLRYKQSAISEFVKTNTKSGLMARMRRYDQQRNVVHMIWHCLTCCSPSDFTVQCHKNDNYKRFCHVNYFDTSLSYYYPLNQIRLSHYNYLKFGDRSF